MRILSNDDIQKVLTPQETIGALEVAYREFALGQAANRPRNHTYFPVEDPRHPGFSFRFKSQEGGNISSGVWAVRITSDMAGVETLPSGVKRRRLLPLAPGGKYVGLVTLYSMTTLEPLAILHDSFIQKMRVGATSAIGIRELSRNDVKVAAMFGSGWQAEAHLECLLMVRPEIEEVRIFSPTAEHRKTFAEVWSTRTGRKIVGVANPAEAVQGCGIITTATAAMDPCFDGNLIEAGTHITCITNPDGTAKRRELDDATYDRADRIVVLSREQVDHDKQFDIRGPVDRGLIEWDDIHELGEILVGKQPGRQNADEVTVFANNTGMGLQFAAVCARVLELAEKADLGHVIPTDWFLEETSP